MSESIWRSPAIYAHKAESAPVKTWNDHAWQDQIEDEFEAMVERGADVLEMRARIRELEQELKIMTEDRDHYRACAKRDRELLKIEHEYGHDALLTRPEINVMLQKASKDEHAIALAFVRKLMGEGRSEHGELCLATDERTVPDLLREALDEQLDSCFYVLAATMKAGL